MGRQVYHLRIVPTRIDEGHGVRAALHQVDRGEDATGPGPDNNCFLRGWWISAGSSAEAIERNHVCCNSMTSACRYDCIRKCRQFSFFCSLHNDAEFRSAPRQSGPPRAMARTHTCRVAQRTTHRAPRFSQPFIHSFQIPDSFPVQFPVRLWPGFSQPFIHSFQIHSSSQFGSCNRF